MLRPRNQKNSCILTVVMFTCVRFMKLNTHEKVNFTVLIIKKKITKRKTVKSVGFKHYIM